MAIHWKTSFVSLDGRHYSVNVYDENSSTTILMVGGSQVFETGEDTDEDIFEPVRPQTGYLRLVVDSLDDIEGLVPVSAMQRPVELVDEDGGVVAWAGYLQDNVFTSPWDSGPLQVEIPVFSPLEVMKSVAFDGDAGYMSLEAILCNIFTKFTLYTEVYIPYSNINYMQLLFNTVVLLGDGNEAYNDYPGISDGSRPPAQDSYYYDVIKELCTYFGWTARDSGSALWLVQVGAHAYRKFDIVRSGDVTLTPSLTYTAGSVDIVIGSNANQYNYLTGVSYIDLVEQVKTEFNMLRTSLADGDTFGSLVTRYDYIYVNYQSGSGSATYKQYQVGGSQLQSFVDLFSRPYDDPNYAGGQMMFLTGSKFFQRLASDSEKFDFKPVLGIKYGDSHEVGSFRSVRSLCGASFPGGIAFTGKLSKYDVVDGFKPDDDGILNFSLRWGNKYFRANTRTWQDTDIINHSAQGATIHGGYIDWISGFQIQPNDLYYIPTLPTLDGEIELTIYGYGSSTTYTGFELVEELEMMAFVPYEGVVNINTDNGENHFRRQLDFAKDNVYERTSKFATHLVNAQYGESLVLNNDFSYYAANHEAGLLQTLAAWKGHTAEQITVDTLFERANQLPEPCDLIAIGNDDYAIVNQRTRWRDSIRTYKIQQQ